MTSFINNQKDKFLYYLKENRNRSELTIKTYKDVLEKALEVVLIENIDDIFVIDLYPYRVQILDQKSKTIAKKISAIRSFVEYMKESGFKVRLKGDDQIKVSKTLPKPVKTSYIKEAIENCDIEERLIIKLLYTLGLRISELSNLKLENFKDDFVYILGKGNKTRAVPILESIKIEIKNYLELNNPKIFFFENEGKKLRENQLRYKLQRVFKSIGLKVTPHQLRHSFATDLLNEGARITDVSELLGHSALSTTEIYTKLSSSLKLKSYLKSHPLCRGEDEDNC